MSEELSHVGIEQKLCPVCREKHDVGVLLDRRLKQSLPRTTCTGLQLCPAHMKVATDEGRSYLVEIDPSQSDMLPDGSVSKTGQVFFLSGIAAIRDIVITEQWGQEIPEGKFAFCDSEAFNHLTTLAGATPVPDDHPTINPPKQEH